MTYTFKLARRLAVSRPSSCAAFTALLLLAACAGGDQFAASDLSDQAAGARPGGKSPKGKRSLTAVEISPASATVAPGGVRQFAATGHYSDGSIRSISVAWSASGGTISTGGLYTAGQDAGTFEVVAVEGNSGLADTAAVSVSGDPPPPPPSEPSGGLANECASPEPGWIWCDDFDQDRLNHYFEYQSAGGSFARVAGVGADGSYGMRARFAQGQVNAGALHLAFGRTPQSYFRAVDGGTRDYREVYWRFYLRHEAGWTGGGGDKLSRAFSFASPDTWAQSMIAHVWSGGSDPGWNYLVLDPASGTDAGGTLKTAAYNDFPNLRWLGAVRGSEPLFDSEHVGAWYCIESRVRLNDAGVSNGVLELWIDGTRDVYKTGMNWVGTFDSYGLNAVYLENYRNAGSPRDQERYFDNFVVSSERIGC